MKFRLQPMYRDTNGGATIAKFNSVVADIRNAVESVATTYGFRACIRLQYSGYAQADWVIGESFTAIRSNFQLFPEAGLSKELVRTCVFYFIEGSILYAEHAIEVDLDFEDVLKGTLDRLGMC